MLGVSIIVAALILALPLFSIARNQRILMSALDDLNAAIQAEAASIAALATAIGNLAAPPDLQPAIDAVNANKAAVDAITAGLPPAP